MNSAVETDLVAVLRRLGGVRPCSGDGCNAGMICGFPKDQTCPDCHGTGHLLDLAPLLAKPKELHRPVTELLYTLSQEMGYRTTTMFATAEGMKPGVVREWGGSFQDLYAVGPSRASNLVYEVARQLGGTATVAIPGYQIPYGEFVEGGELSLKPAMFSFSVTIPDTATVLFVTDKFDNACDFRKWLGLVYQGRPKILRHVLALMNALKDDPRKPRDYVLAHGDGNDNRVSQEYRIISLYPEKRSAAELLDGGEGDHLAVPDETDHDWDLSNGEVICP